MFNLVDMFYNTQRIFSLTDEFGNSKMMHCGIITMMYYSSMYYFLQDYTLTVLLVIIIMKERITPTTSQPLQLSGLHLYYQVSS